MRRAGSVWSACSWRSRLGLVADAVTDTAHRANQLVRMGNVHLAAKMADIDVDDIRQTFEAFVPDMLDDHCSRQDAAGVGDEIFEQAIFLCGEVNASARAADLLGEAVEFEVAHAQDGGAIRGTAAQQCLY